MNYRLLTTKVFASAFLLFSFAFAAAAQNSVFELPVGSKILVRMENEISSKVSSPGDTFTTVVHENVAVRDTVVLPKGTIIEGRVIAVSPASAGGRGGSIEVLLESIRFAGGERRVIDAIPSNPLRGTSAKKTGLLVALGATIAGAVIGGVSKSGVGAAIGAGAGAGIGAGAAVALKGKDIAIKNDEVFSIRLRKSVTLPAFDY